MSFMPQPAAADTSLVVITDHGDQSASNKKSGDSWSASLTSTGDFSVAILTYEDDSDLTITGISIGGTAMTVEVNRHTSTGGVAIATYNGTVSGDINISFTGDTKFSNASITLVSLTGLGSYTVSDTDVGAASLVALAAPGAGRIRIAGAADVTTGAKTWTGVDAELADNAIGTAYQHTSAYHIANSGAAISVSGAEHMAGVSIS